ncbi:MAG: GNAT family N-acetyltransferase [Cyanobacteria bacterium RUI128]|nr:GNAT family N-acetyltransferase [Cyanobacteria bacterium RUI128]
MELVKPSEKYLESYYQACRETWGKVHDNYILHNPDEYDIWKERIFTDYENQEKGIDLPENFLPSITYWLVDNGEYMGTVNIRPKINDALVEYGGSCGVALRSSVRGKNLGLLIVKLALDKMRELKVSPIVLTCEENNEKSWRIIEHLDYLKKELYTTVLNGKNVDARRYRF